MLASAGVDAWTLGCLEVCHGLGDGEAKQLYASTLELWKRSADKQDYLLYITC